MKKFLSISIMLIVFAVGNVRASGEVRLDMYGSKNLKLQSVESSLTWKRFPAHAGTEKEETALLAVSTPLSAAQWSEFQLSFVPDKSGLVAFHFHTPGSRNPASVKPVLICDIKADGSALKNGSFAKLDSAGKPQFWKMDRQAKVVTDAKTGKVMVKVIYNKGRVCQLTGVTGGQKVTLSFKAKLAE